MRDPKPPRLNKRGLEIWFREADGENGYAPVHRKGWIAFILGFAWVMFSGGIGMTMIVLWAFFDLPLPIAIISPFVIAAPGLLRLAKTVRRHS
ncbi:hypothetical protein ACT009_00045 [Sphingomonas sp. Tas61C01]|uniref:hypothetical protein n=1 Tax=Sphingomonas sp. Tas61C01 TaxID=3458297 RepID=UPI00403EE055